MAMIASVYCALAIACAGEAETVAALEKGSKRSPQFPPRHAMRHTFPLLSSEM
jgi:hypothetical protein